MPFITRARIGYVLALAAGLGIGLVTVGAASAAPAKSRPVTHHYSLAASAFAPDSLSSVTNDYLNIWDPAKLTNKDDSRCFDAGLSLPVGSTLKSITFYFWRGDTSGILEVNRQNLPAHAFKRLVKAFTGTSATPTYSKITKSIARADAVVDYTRYAYSVGVCPEGTTAFSGVTVTYTQP